jgi:hypothetical protein
MTVSGTLADQLPLLFESLQFPSLPSLNENETGILASLTILAHEVSAKIAKMIIPIFYI